MSLHLSSQFKYDLAYIHWQTIQSYSAIDHRFIAHTLRYYKRSVSVSGKASGIIYESEYWIGPSAELRIHHHLFVSVQHNSCVVDCFCFFIIILRLLF